MFRTAGTQFPRIMVWAALPAPVFQCSFDVLEPSIQAFFAALSIFQGGWTVQAARDVTDYTDADLYLEELITRSLVVAREDDATGAMRYSFLETLRQFAAEGLSDPERSIQTRRHAHYYLQVAE